MSMNINDFLAFVKAEFIGKKGWAVVFDQPSYDGYGYECTATIKTPGYQHEVFCQVDDDKTTCLSGQSILLECGSVTDKATELPSGALDALTLARIISAIAALETTSKPTKPGPRSRAKPKIIEKIAYVDFVPKRRSSGSPSTKRTHVFALPGQLTLIPLLDETLGFLTSGVPATA